MVYATVFFDVPVARGIIGFFYYSFVPGFVILKLLNLTEVDRIETVLLSVGLSIAFLMLAGLLVNEFSFLFGVSQPLSLIPLMITFNGFVLVGAFLAYLRNKSIHFWTGEFSGLHPFGLLFLILPILSIIGATWVNVYGNNLILLYMIIAISLFFIIGVSSRKLLPSKFYPLAVLMIAVALLYHSSLISNYLVHFGSDLSGEYFAFKTTENGAYWNSITPYFGGSMTNTGRINGMLSVTVLPTIYSNLLNLDSVWVFKIVYPLIFSLVPLGLYHFWQKRFGSKIALFSAFLFMAQQTFYTEMLGLNRQIIAEFFFVLLLIAILSKEIKALHKAICFMIFGFALVASHYGLAEIVLLFLVFTFAYFVVSKRPRRNITAGMVTIFFVLMFVWYIYTAGSAVFYNILEFGDNVYRQLGDFFNPASRGETVLRGLGLEAPPSIWNMVSRAFAYITEALIVVGFIGLVVKRIRVRLDVEYFVLTILSMAFLGAIILVPGLANTLNMTRFYHILLFFLAPLCVLGAEIIVSLAGKWKTEVKVSFLLLIVLIPYFLFQTGFVYEVTGSESWSVPLSKNRMNVLQLHGQFGHTDAYSVFGAQWLSRNVAFGAVQIYADYFSRIDELRGYGLVYLGYVEVLSNITEIKPNGVVYMNSLNIIENITVGTKLSWNSSDLYFLNSLDKIYSNGGSEVYKNQP